MAKNAVVNRTQTPSTSTSSARASSVGSTISARTDGNFVLVHQNNVIAMEEDPGDFTGARPVCLLDLTTPMLKCDFCDVGIRLQSHYALIDSSTKRFHKVLDETSTRIIDMVAGRKWQQCAIQGHTLSKACFLCCGKFHKEKYFTDRPARVPKKKAKTRAANDVELTAGPSRMRLTSQWHNAAKASKMASFKHKLARVLEIVKEQMSIHAAVPSLGNIHTVMRDERATQSRDWIQQVGSELIQLSCGCKTCGVYPLQRWWICTDAGSQGGTWTGGSWVLPCCNGTWRWGTDSKFRLVTIGDPTGSPNDTWVGYIGGSQLLDPEWKQLEQEIKLLNGLVMTNQIRTQAITNKLLLQAIADLNTRAAQPFLIHPSKIKVTAKNPRAKYGTQIYCEDSMLSIESPEVVYDALSVPEGTTPLLSIDNLKNVLAVAGSVCNLEAYCPTKPATRKAYRVFKNRVAKMTNQLSSRSLDVCRGG